jgi:hypothetical protein
MGTRAEIAHARKEFLTQLAMANKNDAMFAMS